MAERRTFLFLQGPASSFHDRLAARLAARGHRAIKINLAFGDRLFWHGEHINHRGRLDDFEAFAGAVMDREKVSGLLVFGDCRPHHVAAMAAARARGIDVFVTELGYLRPDFVTLERDGVSSFSRFPRDPAAIRALAASMPEPDLTPRFGFSFARMAALDVLYNLANQVLSPLFHPHYRWHGIWRPTSEYAGWIWKGLRRPWRTRARNRALASLAASSAPCFVFPLQIATDFQIRVHSPFASMAEAIARVVASFAAHAPAGTRLVAKLHPWDNGLVSWARVLRRAAADHGIADRVLVLDGGDLDALVAGAAGCVTVNSTSGIAALRAGCPTIVLGNAVFDVPGLTHQGRLDGFWRNPDRPDPGLVSDFLRALAGATQVKGGFFDRDAIDAAAEGFAERMTGGLPALPPAAVHDRGSLTHPQRL